VEIRLLYYGTQDGYWGEAEGVQGVMEKQGNKPQNLDYSKNIIMIITQSIWARNMHWRDKKAHRSYRIKTRKICSTAKDKGQHEYRI
jgi:hypothetical protein